MRTAWTLVLAAATWLPAAGQPQASVSASIPKIAFEHYSLPNGLKVILHVDRRAPVVHLNMRYQVGAAYERRGRTGFAHLFEHMLGQGVDSSVDFTVLADRIGATEVSGAVDHDYTEFYETAPSSRLERMLWLESNRFAKLGEAVTQANFDKQREIVRNERRQKVENRPYGRLNMLLHHHLFPEGHPYDHDAIGSHQDIVAATLDDIREFHRTYYTPDNLTLVVAGDFDSAQVKQWIAKYYGSIPPGPGIARPARWTPRLPAPKYVEVRDRVPQERVYLAWTTPGTFEPGDAALGLASFLMNDPQGRLHAALLGGERLCLDYRAYSNSFRDASMFVVEATLRPGVPAAKVESAIAAEIARLAKEEASAAELDQIKDRLDSGKLARLETIAGVAGILSVLNLYFGSPDHVADWAARHAKITPSGVREAVAAWLDTPNRLTIRFLPHNVRQDSVPHPDRSQAPPFQTDRPYRLPEVKSSRLPNGLQVFVVERPALPRLSVQLRMKLGAAFVPTSKAGLPVVALTALNLGTRSRSGQQIDREITGMATTPRIGADGDSLYIGFDLLKRHTPSALALLADLARNPTFETGAFDRHKQEWVNRVAPAASHPDPSLATAVAFGRTHPFGSPVFGTASSLQSLTVADAVEFHKRYWKPDVAALIFAGDITLEEAVNLARAHFGAWQGTAEKAPPIPAPARIPGRVFVFNQRGAPQTLIVQALPAVPRDSPDYASWFLANKVWGGVFSSRLMQNLRQEKGYAYEAGSQIRTFPGHGLWLAVSPVQSDKTKEALIEFVKELKALGGERPVTQQELDIAKENTIRSYPADFELSSSFADQVGRQWALNLPMSGLHAWPEIIAQTSLDAVNAFARKFAKPDSQFFMIIGDREKIEPAIRELNLGAMVPLN